MPDESLEVLAKTTAGTSGGKPAAAAPAQRSDATQRLQHIFESTMGDPGIAESVKGMARAADDAQRAYDQWSQHLHAALTRVALDWTGLAAAKAAAEAAEKRAAGPEAAAREVTAARLEGGSRFGIGNAEPRAEEARGKLPAAQFAASEAETEAREKYRPAAAKQPGARGALGDVEGVAVTVETGETARTNPGPGQALTQQDRDAASAEDPVDPAMKALLVEVAKMQDKHVNGLKQAVNVIIGTSQTVDGLVGLIKTAIARQAQLQGEQTAMAEQMAAWARSPSSE